MLYIIAYFIRNIFLNLAFVGQAFLRSNKPTGCWKYHTPPEAEDEVIMETDFAAISHGVSYRYMICSLLLLGNLCSVYVNLAIKGKL